MRRLLLAFALAGPALCAGAPATAALPLPLYGHGSAAATDDAGAVFANPAGVGVRYPAELLGSWAGVENGPDLSRWALTLGGLGLGLERTGDLSHTIGLSQAVGGERLRVGCGADWRVDARTHRATPDQRLGLLSRPVPWLALGAVAEHLFEPVVAGAVLDRTWTLAAGFRPLALDPARAHGRGTRLTLTADVAMAEGASRGEARVRVGGELEVLPGVLVRGALEDHGGAYLGLTLRGPNHTLGGLRGGGARAERGSGPRPASAGVTFSLHAGEELSVLAGRAQERVAVVRAGGNLGDDAMSGFSLTGGTDVTPAKPLHDQLERALDDLAAAEGLAPPLGRTPCPPPPHEHRDRSAPREERPDEVGPDEARRPRHRRPQSGLSYTRYVLYASNPMRSRPLRMAWLSSSTQPASAQSYPRARPFSHTWRYRSASTARPRGRPVSRRRAAYRGRNGA